MKVLQFSGVLKRLREMPIGYLSVKHENIFANNIIIIIIFELINFMIHWNMDFISGDLIMYFLHC